MSDTYKFKHHDINIPQLTPADRILEADKQLNSAISQQPTKAPMDELTAIELLREVLLGEKTQQLPSNSVQRRKTAQSAAAQELIQAPQPERVTHTPASLPATMPTHKNDAASSLPNNDAPI